MKASDILLISSIILITLTRVDGNDSSYFARGNQLLPLIETEVEVKKEVLTIRRIDQETVAITVDYVFHLPGEDSKTLLMGFEAQTPYGDVDCTPKSGGHPYIKNFTVTINDKSIPSRIAIFDLVNEDLPAQFDEATLVSHGKIPPMIEEGLSDFHYVYYFDALFLAGENSVRHTYEYKISGSAYYDSVIDYLLTPALRWANGEIEDFTLILEMGSEIEYQIKPSFFSESEQWECQGDVKIDMTYQHHRGYPEAEKLMTVWQKSGSIRFNAKHFKPNGELSLRVIIPYFEDCIIDVSGERLPYRHLPTYQNCVLRNEFSRKVLCALPYAQQGASFEDQDLKRYYKLQPWYEEKSNVREVDLTEEQIEWQKFIKEMHDVEFWESFLKKPATDIYEMGPTDASKGRKSGSIIIRDAGSGSSPGTRTLRPRPDESGIPGVDGDAPPGPALPRPP